MPTGDPDRDHPMRELRTDDRAAALQREEWITRFVNIVVRELRPGLDRMTVVAGAREAWTAQPDAHARDAARAWLARHDAGIGGATAAG